MFCGHFDFYLHDTGKLPDAAFVAAGKHGQLRQLLTEHPLVGEWHGRNMLFDNAVANIFYRLFGGGSPPEGWDCGDSGAILAFINMSGSGTSGEPSYQDASTCWTGYGPISIHAVTDTVDSSGGSKRFVEDQIESYQCAKDPNGREAIFFRNRWLWLPSQAVGNIYSAAVWVNMDGDSTGTPYSDVLGRSARVRLKDSAGNPIIINKLSTQALLIDYALTLYSV
jgi:hypothetical protein